MLFATPPLDEQDLAVAEALDRTRESLRVHLRGTKRWQGPLRRHLRARAARGSNSIEGYDVSLDDALAVLDDEEPLDADQRTTAEIRGYRNAMTYVQELAADLDFRFDESLIRALHFMMLGHELSKTPGRYRRSSVFVEDEDRGQVVYEGPSHESVPELMGQLVDEGAVSRNGDGHPVVVTAAMVHLNFVMIHPFRDGNGRMARCLQTLTLARNQIVQPEFSSIEEWLGRNTPEYYAVLAEVGGGAWHPERDAHPWIRFNLRAHYIQAETVAIRVRESAELWDQLVTLITRRSLPDRSLNALFNASLGLRVVRTQYEREAGLERHTANRDLKELVTAGLLNAHGETRGRFYTGTEPLRAVYGVIRSGRARIDDPYAMTGR